MQRPDAQRRQDRRDCNSFYELGHDRFKAFTTAGPVAYKNLCETIASLQASPKKGIVPRESYI